MFEIAGWLILFALLYGIIHGLEILRRILWKTGQSNRARHRQVMAQLAQPNRVHPEDEDFFNESYEDLFPMT